MKNPLDKKRYEYLNEFGYNIDSNKRRIIDFDMQIKRHKNSDSKQILFKKNGKKDRYSIFFFV